MLLGRAFNGLAMSPAYLRNSKSLLGVYFYYSNFLLYILNCLICMQNYSNFSRAFYENYGISILVLLGAGQGSVDVVIVDPQGNRAAIRPRITKQPDAPDTYRVEYTPREPGLHAVNIYFAGQAIPNSPFSVGVGPGILCFVQRRGLVMPEISTFLIPAKNLSYKIFFIS